MMNNTAHRSICVLLVVLAACFHLYSAELTGLGNDRVQLTVTMRDGALVGDRLEGRPDWLRAHGTTSVAFETDGGFALDLMYTGWRAPDRVHNADNPVLLTATDFVVVERPRFPARIDRGGEQYLARVDVADADEAVLAQEPDFDRRCRGGDEFGQAA